MAAQAYFFAAQVSCYTFSDAALDSAENNGCVADLQRRIAKALELPEVGFCWGLQMGFRVIGYGET